MPVYTVTLKENASPDKLAEAKQAAIAKGGKITHEFNLIKGFTVEYPEGHVDTLESNDSINVEADQEMKIQSD